MRGDFSYSLSYADFKRTVHLKPSFVAAASYRIKYFNY